MNTYVICEGCGFKITVEELFQSTECTSINEHWYCCKKCYDKDFSNDFFEEDDEW